MQFQTAALLEQRTSKRWNRSTCARRFSKAVYGQELGSLALDSALALNALRQIDSSRLT
jgi:hypothetical protein